MAAYCDSKSFKSGKYKLTDNLNGKIVQGLSEIDIFFESAGPPYGLNFKCKVFYQDNTEDSWEIYVPEKKKQNYSYHFDHLRNRLIARNDFRAPESWHPCKIGQKSYYQVNNNIDFGNYNMQRVFSAAWFFPLTKRVPKMPKKYKNDIPLLHKIAIRGIKIFDKTGKNISSLAEISGQCQGGYIAKNKKINDSTDSYISKEAELNKYKEGTIKLSFKEPVIINEIAIYHGVLNGLSIAYITKQFKIEYFSNNTWHTIKNGEVVDNSASFTKHKFPAQKTTAIRLTVKTQEGLYDYTKIFAHFDNPLLRIKKAENIPKNTPFMWWYLGHDETIHFAASYKKNIDIESYKKWKKNHSNFLGFPIVEGDSDLRHQLRWGNNIEKTKKRYMELGKKIVLPQELPPPPKTKEEALKQYETIFKNYNNLLFGDIGTFCSRTIWMHHGLEWGGKFVTFEHANNIPLGLQISAARGAARQYGNKPWGMYLATFVGNGYTNNLKSGKNGSYYYGPNCGKSASEYRRNLFVNYASGANFVDFEHPKIVFYKKYSKDIASRKLSRQGIAAKEIVDFAKKHPKRGKIYTPVAILLDYHHGWSPGDKSGDNGIFLGHFPKNMYDRMLETVLYSIFGYDPVSREGYANKGKTSHSGLCDILLLNPPNGFPKVLDNYKAAILLGNVKINKLYAEHLKSYVEKGGTLLINVAQLNKFLDGKFAGISLHKKNSLAKKTIIAASGKELKGEDFKYNYRHAKLVSAKALAVTENGAPLATIRKFGKGNIILTLQPYLTDQPGESAKAPRNTLPLFEYLLSLITYETSPVIIQGNKKVQFIVSKLKKSWRVALINNHGVYKYGNSAPEIKKQEKAEITMILRSSCKNATELISGKKLNIKHSKKTSKIKLTIPPGQLAIIDFTI